MAAPEPKITPVEPPVFDAAFRDQLNDLFLWRRDVRRFKTDPLPDGMMEDLLATAQAAPSVGLSQPWRWVRVNRPELRDGLKANFSCCNRAALEAYEGDKAQTYATLKLEGLDRAPEVIGVFADVETAKGAGLGSRTLPDTLAYSVVGAVTLMWLAARAEGIGLGWVSILEPEPVKSLLDVPEDWRFLGLLCIGYPAEDNITPELERAGWESRGDWRDHVIER